MCGLGNRLDSLKELHITVLNNNINRIEIEFYNENETYVSVEKKKLQTRLWELIQKQISIMHRSLLCCGRKSNQIKEH